MVDSFPDGIQFLRRKARKLTQMNMNKAHHLRIFDSFCLEGKITEKHAEQIKAILEDELLEWGADSQRGIRKGQRGRN